MESRPALRRLPPTPGSCVAHTERHKDSGRYQQPGGVKQVRDDHQPQRYQCAEEQTHTEIAEAVFRGQESVSPAVVVPLAPGVLDAWLGTVYLVRHSPAIPMSSRRGPCDRAVI
jgi:hypothetical protein